MEYLTNAFAFIVVLGVMIFFHEFGHFITAKAFGMRVFIFSFGFGTRLFGFKWGDTDCRVSAIPLGGYVKLEGEADDHLSEDVAVRSAAESGTDARDFAQRPRWQRFLVYLAGPFMNVVLTIGVLTTLYMIGFQVEASFHDRPVIGVVEAGSPAQQAGVQPGDEIVSIDGRPVASWEEAQYGILLRPGTAIDLAVRRAGQEQRIAVKSATTQDKVGSIGVYPLVRIGTVLPGAPAEQAGLKADDAILAIDGTPVKSFADIPPLVAAAKDRDLVLSLVRDGQAREMRLRPRDAGEGPKIGIGPKMVLKRFAFLPAVAEASRWTWGQVKLTFEVLKRLLTAQLSPKTMMGPLGIAKASGEAARGGIGQLAMLVAVISLQIGIMNLFPLPPLDGGHLAIIAGEGILRRDFSADVKAWIMNAGAIALFLLIGLVLYSDLSKTSLLGRYLP